MPYVMIVEDSATDVNVLQILLKRLEINYSVFYDGNTALSMIKDLPVPDAVFLDLEMPGISGFDIIAMLKDDPDYDGVPVVAYTSKLGEMNAAREAGFHSFLGKPLKNAVFSEQLENIFNDVPVWDAR